MSLSDQSSRSERTSFSGLHMKDIGGKPGLKIEAAQKSKDIV